MWSKSVNLFQKIPLSFKMPVTEAASNAVVPSPKKLKVDDSKLQVAKLSENATLPTRGSPLAAGYDLYSAEVNCQTKTSWYFSLILFVGRHRPC